MEQATKNLITSSLLPVTGLPLTNRRKSHFIPLPSTAAIMADPRHHLPRLLHRQVNGAPRAYLDSSALAAAILDGTITVDDIRLPWRPLGDDDLVDAIIAEGDTGNETPEHRLLKLHARLLALAMDPGALLLPECAATVEPYPLRADLMSCSAYGVSQTFECGATDGRSVVDQLLDGDQVRVTVLPFASLQLPIIRAYGFRRADNPSPPILSAAHGARAWTQLIRQAQALTGNLIPLTM